MQKVARTGTLQKAEQPLENATTITYKIKVPSYDWNAISFLHDGMTMASIKNIKI